ncbi:MAG: CotH kinase family protein [Clostridia bacterium]|nr:CotH kinase family protein [Clostridia bacterium]
MKNNNSVRFHPIALLIAFTLSACTLAENVEASSSFPALETRFFPVDAQANVLYLPVDENTRFPIQFEAGWQTVSLDVENGIGGLSVQSPGSIQKYPIDVVQTNLPVLCIDTESGNLPEESRQTGKMRFYEANGKGGVQSVSSPIEINLRGNTSRRYPKGSYKMTLVNPSGEQQDLALAGLRMDDDWILNPMYSDTSKIREALSYWLWAEINSCGQAAASSSVAYAEVILNGEYYGLYGIQERVDRKQVDANPQTDILYKVRTNERPTPEELMRVQGEREYKGIELSFVGMFVTDPWSPAADYIALLDGEEAAVHSTLSLDNAVDYALWSALVQARDGHYKNQFIHCAFEQGQYTLYHIPWDLNHTLGDLWNGDAADTNYLEYAVTRIALDDAVEALLNHPSQELISKLQLRWAELREGPITEENILSRAHMLFDTLNPAIQRDSMRWPECGMGEGNAANIRDIEDYIRVILPRLDGWIRSLATER